MKTHSKKGSAPSLFPISRKNFIDSEKSKAGWKPVLLWPEQLKLVRHGVVFFCFLLSALCFQVSGQPYSIDWFKIAGSGGASSNETYSVSGTAGLQITNPPAMTGGSYSLTGTPGNLIAAIQTPGAPLFSIIHAINNTAIVSWPLSSTGWNLRENSNLTTTNWIAPSETSN